MIVLENVHTYYGQIHALKGVFLRVEQGEIVTLIGSNGAGKTTTLNTISGLLAPRLGSITLEGKSIAHVPAHDVAKLGVSQAPEGRRIFARLTVQENLEMGAFYRTDSAEISADFERVVDLFPRLKERLKQPGGTLSGGEQQMLAIGRALMSRPRILLLDEPSMGLAPILVQIIFEVVHNINQQGTTILLVEQNAHAALDLAHRGYVLQTGKIVLSDTTAELRKNPMIQKVYLGID